MGAAAFGKPDKRAVTWAALAGAFAPDLSLYLMFAVSRFFYEIPAETIFRELYYSDAWQQVFAIDNSFLLWGIALGLAVWRRVPWAIAFTGAALLHIALDFPLHNHDARMHFWPLTDWKFYSPISYWQSSRGGNLVGAAELTISAICVVYLFRRIKDFALRIAFGTLAVLEVMTTQIWRLFF